MARTSWAQHLIRPRIHYLYHSEGMTADEAIAQTMEELRSGALTGKIGDRRISSTVTPPKFAIDLRQAVAAVGVDTDVIDLLIASVASATDAQIPALLAKHLKHRTLSAAEHRRLLAAIKRYRREVNRF